MHRAEGVLKSRMRSPRVNKISERQLPDSPQALKRWMVDYLAFPIVVLYEPVNGVPNLVDGQTSNSLPSNNQLP